MLVNMVKARMANLTDELSERDWNEARTWVDRLRTDAKNDDLMAEFEEWLAEVPARAGAYRKILDTLELLPLLKEQSTNPNGDHCPKTRPRPDRS